MGKKRIFIAATVAVIGVLAFGGVALAGTMLSASPLTGAAEVDSMGNPNKGDTDGSGTADLNLIPKREKICYSITVDNIAPATATHIHKAPVGQDGPIIKELKAPSDGTSSGCARLSRMKIMQIKNNPSAYYINVHNSEFPDGALRGQLHN